MTHLSKIDAASLGARLEDQITGTAALKLRDFPEFPLAMNVEMPEDFGFAHGNVGMAFHQLTLAGHGEVEVTPNEDGLDVTFPALRLNGVYRLASKKTVPMDMDIGGTMLDVEEETYPAGAAAGDDNLSPDQAQAMLDTARAQRTKLRETPNGTALVDTFSNHNEALNSAFVRSDQLRSAWRAGGATQAMSVDTHTAVDKEDTINSNDAKYTNEVGPITYNGNAFTQQLNVTTALAVLSGGYFSGEFDPKNEYVKAALATMEFGSAVGQSGNAKDKINPLDPNGVYAHVNSGTKPPDATPDQLSNFLDQAEDGGAAAAALAEENQWRVLDEQDRTHVRRLLYSIAREQIDEENQSPEALWSGACSADLDGITAQITATESGGKLRIKADVTLPAFMVDLDDSRWTGATADTLCERLRDMYFVRHMLQEGIRTGLRKMLQSTVRDLIAAKT